MGVKAKMLPLLVALVLLALSFSTDSRMRRGAEAKSLKATETDRGTTRALGIAHGVSFFTMFVVAPLLWYFDLARLPMADTIAWFGVVLMLLGLALKVWAMRTLGAFYTRTLRVAGGQQLVEIGPYQRLRHPGYTGGLCIWIGASLATANWISSILVPVLMIGVYQYRIRSEEQMLLGAFGKNYGDYMRRTWRLVPFIY